MIHIRRKATKFLKEYIFACIRNHQLDLSHALALRDKFIEGINKIQSLSIDFYSDFTGYSQFMHIYKNGKSKWYIMYYLRQNKDKSYDVFVYDILSHFQKLPPKRLLSIRTKTRKRLWGK